MPYKNTMIDSSANNNPKRNRLDIDNMTDEEIAKLFDEIKEIDEYIEARINNNNEANPTLGE